MLSSIVLKYNQKFLNLDTLYKINLYKIDQELYIDMDEVTKFSNWIQECNFKNIPLGLVYSESERHKNSELYIENNKTSSDDTQYFNISMEHMIFRLILKSYKTLKHVINKYSEHLNDLNDFKKPDNAFKQIISSEGNVIYVVHFKKHINNIKMLHNAFETESSYYDILIDTNELLDINYLYPLDLTKILNDKKIDNGTTYDYIEIKSRKQKLHAEFKRLSKLMKLC